MRIETRHDKAEALKKEQSERENLVFLLAFGVFIVGSLGWQMAKKGWDFLGLILILTALAGGAFALNQLLKAFALRDRIIKFKMNVDPLFIEPSAEMVEKYGEDVQIHAARDSAIEGLFLAGPDTDRVKIYTFFFRDVIYTSHWWEWPDDGSQPILRCTKHYRKGVCVNETWEEFQAFLSETKAARLAESRRELYRLNDTDDVQRKIFNQI